MERKGIWCIGNIIADNIKLIDHWPKLEGLALVQKTKLSAGGGAANVAVDLARMQAPFPLYLGGCIGDDAMGQYLLNYFRQYPIDTSSIITSAQASTSWTDVMTEAKTGRRTFFHHTGASDDYAPYHVLDHYKNIPAKIIYVAYLSLLKQFDQRDLQFGSKAGRLFKTLKEQEFMIALDCVSMPSHEFFQSHIRPCLVYVDIFILNESEAKVATDIQITDDDDHMDQNAITRAIACLSSYGPKTIVIHYPKGATVYHDGHISKHASYDIDKADIAGAVGAGDAFSAGLLFGIHEGWSMDTAIDLACCCARFNLTDLSATEGIKPLSQMQKWQKTATKKIL